MLLGTAHSFWHVYHRVGLAQKIVLVVLNVLSHQLEVHVLVL